MISLKSIFSKPSLRISRTLSDEFDRKFYLNRYSDVAKAGLDPLQHYLRVGWREGRWPRDDFDTRFYLWLYPDVTASRKNPFYHYVKFGREAGRIASPEKLTDAVQRQSWDSYQIVASEFDRDFYLWRYPDVADAGADPVVHYQSVGWRQNRAPRADFNTGFYLWLYPDVAEAGINPFHHYLADGRAEGRIATPERLEDSDRRQAWEIYSTYVLKKAREGKKSGAYFDTESFGGQDSEADTNGGMKRKLFLLRYEHELGVSEICVDDTNDIRRALTNIEDQIPLFERATASLHTESRGRHSTAFKISKNRQRFNFTIEEGVRQFPPKFFRTWPAVNRRIPEMDLIRLDQDIASWVRQNLSPTDKVVAVAARPADRILDAFSKSGMVSSNLIRLSGGEGDLVQTKIVYPDRHRPGRTSFSNWLANTGDNERASIKVFLLGEDAADLDREQLSGLLGPGQFLLISAPSDLGFTINMEWSGIVRETSDSVLICSPGLAELDPVAFDSTTMLLLEWPRISVVTVSYNQGKFLEACLNSVLGQEYPNLEYIVIDAGSTDQSASILESYKTKLTKLIIEPDHGQSDGLNKGFGLATGDILTWVNSDDMLAPGALRRVARAFMVHQCDLIAGGCERIGENDDHVNFLHHSALPFARPVSLGYVSQLRWFSSWDQGDYFFQPEVFFTTDIWKRSGAHLKQHLYWGMDWDLWIRMALAGATITHISAPLARSREQPLQKVTSDLLYMFELRNIILDHHDVLSAVENFIGSSGLRRGKGGPLRWLQKVTGMPMR